MLIYATDYLTQLYSGFNVFSYLTTRAILSALTALVLSFAFGPYLIQRLTMQRIGQQIRQVGPESHFPKAGTPTMGGALILLAIAVSTVLWANLSNRFVLARARRHVVLRRHRLRRRLQESRSAQLEGLERPRQALLANDWSLRRWRSRSTSTAENPAVEHALLIPYIPGISIPLGAVGYVLFTALVVVCASNGVNLTDGLDGLAIMPAVLVGGGTRRVRLRSPATSSTPLISGSRISRGPASYWFSVRPWLAPAWASCGSTPIPRKSSWATSVR